MRYHKQRYRSCKTERILLASGRTLGLNFSVSQIGPTHSCSGLKLIGHICYVHPNVAGLWSANKTGLWSFDKSLDAQRGPLFDKSLDA